MTSPASLVIRSSRLESSATCLVCGNDIPAGQGVTARYGERTLRFKCPGCLSRFEADPERYLAGNEAACCNGEHEHSPASEWRCD
jgi:hypothetical protein